MLRDYQKDICSRTVEAFKTHRSVMVQMPTGTGKTIVLAQIVNEELRNVSSTKSMKSEECSPFHSVSNLDLSVSGETCILIVAHRRELVEQIKATIHRLRIDDGNITVCSIQWLAYNINKVAIAPSLVVIDEAHHALAKTYRMMWEAWHEARFLGLTATPCRMNRAGFTDLFECLVMSWSIGQFIKAGWLSLFDYYSIKADSEEQRLINSLEKRGADGDYQAKELNAVLNRRPSIERLYESVVRYAEGKKGIVYAININHAHNIAEYYREHGVNAVAIDSRTPAEVRRQTVEDFKAGKIRVMVSVDLFSEGFDCPDVEFIQLARPTLSLAKYLQMVGRGLRKSEGKETCVMIDNVGLYRMFGLPAADRDWQAMFEGRTAGKGSKARDNAVCNYAVSAKAENCTMADTDLEEIIGHESLTALLERNANLRLTGDGILTITGRGSKTRYVDLRNDMEYASRPTSVWFGDVEMLKVGDKYYDRTKHPYKAGFSGKKYCIKDRGFYVDIFMNNDADWCRMLRGIGKPNILHTACILANDDTDCYIVSSTLEDGSIIILDRKKNYYHVKDGRKKRYIGNEQNDGEMQKLISVIRQLRDRAAKKVERRKAEKQKERLTQLQNAEPFSSNNKWGLRLGGRVIVPPIYRSIKEPVGYYCAIEKNYGQWGVVALDGTMMVEPKYSDIEISTQGIVTGTKVTGTKEQMRLP